MREAKTNVPALVLNQRGKSRIAFMPADVDRRYARRHLTDHGDLLANVVRWVAGDSIPLNLEGPGFIDCHIYEQPGRLILHLLNLTSAGTWRAPVEELIRVGPLRVRVNLPSGMRPGSARFLVSATIRPIAANQGMVAFEVPSILDHEVVVIS